MGRNLKAAYKTIMDDHFPPEMTISFGDQKLVYRKRAWKIEDEKTGELVEKGLRYGENPGQEAALYELVNGNLTLGECAFIAPNIGLVSALGEEHLLQFGKHPGKTNLTDVDNALNILKYLMDEPAVSIMKHSNPCGVAQADSLEKAYANAYLADRVAAFGGAVVCNRPMDKPTAEQISESYVEVVAAPDYEDGAIDVLKQRKNLRIVQVPRMDKLAEFRFMRFVDFKSLMDGGIIVQQSPLNRIKGADDFLPAKATRDGQEVRMKRDPTKEELADLLFGWQVEQGVTSNSVLFVKDRTTVAIGTGEQDRVGVVKIAVNKAYEKYADSLCYRKHGMAHYQLLMAVRKKQKGASLLEEIEEETEAVNGGIAGSRMVSDAFFPFRDGVDVGIGEKITAIVQPGGSLRDWEAIEACNEATPPVAMVFTGQRAFKH